MNFFEKGMQSESAVEAERFVNASEVKVGDVVKDNDGENIEILEIGPNEKLKGTEDEGSLYVRAIKVGGASEFSLSWKPEFKIEKAL